MASELLTSGKMAESLGVSPAKIKKALTDLGIEPTSKKGACSYYDSAVLTKVKSALK